MELSLLLLQLEEDNGTVSDEEIRAIKTVYFVKKINGGHDE